MTKEERDSLEKSIAYAKDTLAKGLIIDPEASSQLYRMIAYYQEKLDRDDTVHSDHML